MNFETMSKQRKMVLIAAAIGVISMFLPWISISIPIFGQTASQNGMHGWGIVIFLCMAAAGVIAFMGNQSRNLDKTSWMLVLILGGIAAISMIINFFQALEALSLYSFGFYGALAGSIGIVAFAFMYRSATDSLQDGFDSLKGDINRKMNTTNTTRSNDTTPTTTHVSHTSNNDPTRPTV
jgi:peptidoglycan/LPS O-acetylase OafA/YrhL